MSGVRQHNLGWHEQLKDVRADMFRDDTLSGGYVSNRHRRKGKHSGERNPFEGFELRKEVSSGAGNRRGDIFSNFKQGPVENREIYFRSERSEVTGSRNADSEAFMAENRDQSSHSEEDYESETKRDNSRAEGDTLRSDGDLKTWIASLEEELRRRDANDVQQAKNKKVETAAVWGSLIAGTLTVVAGAAVLIVGMLGDHKSNIMNL